MVKDPRSAKLHSDRLYLGSKSVGTGSSMKFGRLLFLAGIAAALGGGSAFAAQIETGARAAIPQYVQQLIAVDYDTMQNSPAAMSLKARVLPPELKQLESALKSSGFNEARDVDTLVFAAYRTTPTGEDIKVVGIGQGQFQVNNLVANFVKHKVKPIMIRNNKLWPMGTSGMLVTFLNPTTMLFGSEDALKPALAARDGLAPSFLSNSNMMSAMQKVDSQPIWSILDAQGTQYMMHTLLGQASQLADYTAVKKRLLSSSYTMNFNNGVKFDLYVDTSDTFTAATMSSLLNAAAMYEKVSGTPVEQKAIDATTIDSSGGTLEVKYSSSDSQFTSLLQSPLFQNVVH